MTLNTVTLSTQRLTLKPFTANDADETYNCITPTLTRYMAWDPQPRHELIKLGVIGKELCSWH